MDIKEYKKERIWKGVGLILAGLNGAFLLYNIFVDPSLIDASISGMAVGAGGGIYSTAHSIEKRLIAEGLEQKLDKLTEAMSKLKPSN
jgi:hypothetical protein